MSASNSEQFVSMAQEINLKKLCKHIKNPQNKLFFLNVTDFQIALLEKFDHKQILKLFEALRLRGLNKSQALCQFESPGVAKLRLHRDFHLENLEYANSKSNIICFAFNLRKQYPKECLELILLMNQLIAADVENDQKKMRIQRKAIAFKAWALVQKVCPELKKCQLTTIQELDEKYYSGQTKINKTSTRGLALATFLLVASVALLIASSVPGCGIPILIGFCLFGIGCAVGVKFGLNANEDRKKLDGYKVGKAVKIVSNPFCVFKDTSKSGMLEDCQECHPLV